MHPFRLLNPTTRRAAPYLSASSARTYQTCPHAFRLQHMERKGRMSPDTAASKDGTIVHEVMQVINRHRIHEGTYPEPGQPMAHIVTDVLDRYVQAITPAHRLRLEPMALGFAEKYVRGVGADLTPVTAESEFLIEDPESGLRLYGLIDMATTDMVVDYKTSTRPIEHAGEHADQMHVYAVAYHTIAGTWPQTLAIVNLVKPTGAVRLLEMDCEEKFVCGSVALSRRIWYDVEAKKFDPRPGSWCRTCDFGADPNTCAIGYGVRQSRR